MTEAQLAARLDISQSSLHGIESSEAADSIRLGTLRRAAEALDCELQYVLVPRRPLSVAVEERALALARAELDRVAHTMALEAQEVVVTEQAVEERARELIRHGGLWGPG